MDPVDHFNTQAKEGIPTALTLKENVNYSARTWVIGNEAVTVLRHQSEDRTVHLHIN
jgi:hypothetical protein